MQVILLQFLEILINDNIFLLKNLICMIIKEFVSRALIHGGLHMSAIKWVPSLEDELKKKGWYSVHNVHKGDVVFYREPEENSYPGHVYIIILRFLY